MLGDEIPVFCDFDLDYGQSSECSVEFILDILMLVIMTFL